MKIGYFIGVIYIMVLLIAAIYAYNTDKIKFVLYSMHNYLSILLTTLLAIYIIPTINKYIQNLTNKREVILSIINNQLENIDSNISVILEFINMRINDEKLNLRNTITNEILLNSIKSISRSIWHMDKILTKIHYNKYDNQMNIIKQTYYKITDIVTGDKWKYEINEIKYTTQEYLSVAQHYDMLKHNVQEIMIDISTTI